MGILDKVFGGDYEARSATRQAEETMDILKRDYPQLMQLLSGQKVDEAKADLGAAQAVTPGYNDLAMGELERMSPRASALQDTMDTTQARNDVARLQELGPQAGHALRAADEAGNAEFYKNLDLAGKKYAEALGALSPNLSAGQRAEIERGTARLNPYGTDNSAVSTSEKAMNFGTAHQGQLANFANVLNGITSGLQGLKTGLNPANIALGRDSRTSPVMGAITPVTKPNTNAAQIGTNLYGQVMGAVRGHDTTNAQMFKSWGDALNQDSSSFANIAKGAMALGG